MESDRSSHQPPSGSSRPTRCSPVFLRLCTYIFRWWPEGDLRLIDHLHHHFHVRAGSARSPTGVQRITFPNVDHRRTRLPSSPRRAIRPRDGKFRFQSTHDDHAQPPRTRRLLHRPRSNKKLRKTVAPPPAIAVCCFCFPTRLAATIVYAESNCIVRTDPEIRISLPAGS